MSNRKAESQKTRARKTRAPDRAERPEPKKKRSLRLIGLLAVAGLVMSAILTLVLLEGPDAQGQRPGQAQPGGESTVPKTGNVKAAASAPQKASEPSSPPPQAAVEATVPVLMPALPAAPSPEPVPALERSVDAVPAEPTVMSQATVPLPAKPEAVSEPEPQKVSPPIPDPRPQLKARTAPAPALPWQGEAKPKAEKPPVVANLPRQGTSEPVRLPSRSDVRGWIRSTAREFVGGVDADGLPLYRFDIWLEAPEGVRAQIQQVSYEYLAPSAKPPLQNSNDSKSGFRVKFGAAACAEKARIMLTMNDGNTRKVNVDGCQILH